MWKTERNQYTAWIYQKQIQRFINTHIALQTRYNLREVDSHILLNWLANECPLHPIQWNLSFLVYYSNRPMEFLCNSPVIDDIWILSFKISVFNYIIKNRQITVFVQLYIPHDKNSMYNFSVLRRRHGLPPYMLQEIDHSQQLL